MMTATVEALQRRVEFLERFVFISSKTNAAMSLLIHAGEQMDASDLRRAAGMLREASDASVLLAHEMDGVGQ